MLNQFIIIKIIKYWIFYIAVNFLASWAIILKFVLIDKLDYFINLQTKIIEMKNMLLPCRINSYYLRLKMSEENFKSISFDLTLTYQNIESIKDHSYDEVNLALQEYKGQPSLSEYLRRFNLEGGEEDCFSEKIKNKKMSRLDALKLPKIFYQHKGPNIAERLNLSQEQLIKNQKESNIHSLENINQCLSVGQTIVFFTLNFEKFKTIFHEDIIKNWKRMKKIVQQSETEKYQFGEYYYSTQYIQTTLFDLFCLPNLDLILWPAVLLQSLRGSVEDLKEKKKDFGESIFKEQSESLNSNLIFEKTLTDYIFSMFMHKNEPQILKETENQSISKIIQKVNEAQQSQSIFINLLGTNYCFKTNENIVPWLSFSKIQQDILITKTPFKYILPIINQTIINFNEFKSREDTQINGANGIFCLNKLGICNLKGIQSLCVPLRYIFHSQGDRVLVQYFDKNQSLGKNRHYWLSNKDVMVNETLPKHSLEQRQLYYLFDSSFSLPEVISYIYSDYFGAKKTFIQALRIIYPAQIIASRFEKAVKCSVCEHAIKNQKILFCTFCLKKQHFECGSNNKKLNQNSYTQNIHLAFQFNQIWICKQCQLCKLCRKKLVNQKSAYICTLCQCKYHRECGRIIANGKQIQKQKFICELCMKCISCNKKLRFEEYYQQQGSLFCHLCYSVISSNEVCNICFKKDRKEQFVTCIYGCTKIYHFSCDQDIAIYSQTQIESIYHCEKCRIQKKKIGMLLVISQLFVFDEDEFFDEPYYEEIEDYHEIIKNSLCLQDIKHNVYVNKYNENTSQAILKDLELIAENAMHFNMPKQDVHFKAKTLLLLSSLFINSMKHILDASPKQIMLISPQNQFKEARQNFYADISKNFVKYFLNFGKQDPQIEIVHNNDQITRICEDDDILTSFSAKKLLVQSFRNCKLKLKFEDQPMLIRHLFETPRLTPGVFCKVKQELCFYHPKQKYRIIYQCQLCWETYCCTKVCYRHIFCKKCKDYGCDCNRKQCQCPALKSKQYKEIQEQIKPYLQKNKLTKLQYTEYHKYCLDCARAKQRNCQICKQLCYYGYQICKNCKKLYHIKCEDVPSQKLHSQRIGLDEEHSEIQARTDIFRLHKTCRRCSSHNQNLIQCDQELQKAIKKIKKKYRRINDHLQIFKTFYQKNQFHLTQKYIIKLMEENYDQFASRIYFFEQYQNSLRQQNQKIINHELSISFYDQYRLSPQNIINQIVQGISLSIDQIYYTNQCNQILQSYLNYNWIQQNQEKEFNKEFLFVNKRQIEQFSFQKQLLDIFWEPINKQLPTVRCFLLIHTTLDPMNIQNSSTRLFYEGKQQQDTYLKNLTEFLKYLKSGLLILPQRGPRYIVVNPSYNFIYNPEQNKINKPQLYHFGKQPLGIKKLQILSQYLSKFCMKIFEDNKRCLRKGNTIILSSQIFDWKVLKRISGAQYYFRFFRQPIDQNWIFSMNGKQYQISQIRQIISILHQNGIKIYNFDDICHFFGFTLNSSSYEIPKHFSNFMQTEQFYRMSARQIKDRVVHIYNQYQWNDDGTIQHRHKKQLYKMTHQKPYYLNKRKPTTAVQQHITLRETNVQLMTYIDLNRCEWTQESVPQIQPEIIPQPTMQVYVGPSVIDRLGLFASHDIQPYTCIIEYAGEVISEAVADLREKKFKEGCYFFTLGMTNGGKKQIIDASRKGNEARFLNHSCDPNCKAKTVTHNGKPKIIIYTMKSVKKGEELTYDYQFNIESTGHLACKCGSLLCQGRLN